jgi:hypothetical protein
MRVLWACGREWGVEQGYGFVLPEREREAVGEEGADRWAMGGSEREGEEGVAGFLG